MPISMGAGGHLGGPGSSGGVPVPLYYNLNQGLPFQPSSMPDYQQPLMALPEEPGA